MSFNSIVDLHQNQSQLYLPHHRLFQFYSRSSPTPPSFLGARVSKPFNSIVDLLVLNAEKFVYIKEKDFQFYSRSSMKANARGPERTRWTFNSIVDLHDGGYILFIVDFQCSFNSIVDLPEQRHRNSNSVKSSTFNSIVDLQNSHDIRHNLL